MDGDIIQAMGRVGPGAVLGLAFILFVLENALPLRRRTRPLPGRVAVNLCLTGMVFLVGTYVVRGVALGVSHGAGRMSLGILNLADAPFPARFVFGFLLMDLSFYYWHRANHRWPLLWRFHNVHHIDPDLDVSTSFRFHAVEAFYSTGFRVAQVGLIGVDPVTYVVYELVFTCETAFHHSNLRIPVRIERIINKVIVTPRMHGIHHSTVEREDNSNYSVIFRWWDDMHRSLNLGVRQSEVTIGVPAYLSPEDNRLVKVLVAPFVKQRDYWLMQDGSRPVRTGEADREHMQE